MTAAEKLMSLGCRAVCHLILAHFTIRRIADPASLDPVEIKRTAEALHNLAWEVERSRA